MITPNLGYNLTNTIVTMGGVVQIFSIINNIGICSIPIINGTIVISSVNISTEKFDLTMNKTNSSIAVNDSGIYFYSTTADCLTYGHSIIIETGGNIGYTLQTFTVTMGGVSQTTTITSGTGTCTIANVTGNIIASASSLATTGSFVIQFNGNGNTSGTMTSITRNYNTSFSLPTNTFLKIGNYFNG